MSLFPKDVKSQSPSFSDILSSFWIPVKFGWCRDLHCIDALLNALNCIGPLALDFKINQMHHDHTPDQESRPQRQDDIKEQHGTYKDRKAEIAKTLEPELQDRRFRKSSKPVQVQDNFNQVQV